TTLAPGESTTCHASYVTTQTDVNNGSITNSATATGTPPGGGTPVESPPDEVTITAEANPAMTVQKSADPTTYTAAGQTITYSYVVTNTGNVTLTGIGVTDDQGLSVSCPVSSLDPGQNTTCQATYTTTQADVDSGSITNSAYAHGTPPGGGTPIDSPPDEVTITAEANPAMTVQKSADPTTYTAAGETISYTYLVTNTGNVTLTNVGINDDLPGLSTITCTTTTLAPGESTYCHASYVTTQTDVNNGSITNSATATGTPPGGGTPVESPPDEVTVTLQTNPGISVAKAADPSTFSTVGQTINYTYTVTNTGDTSLNSVGVTDDLPGLSAVTCDATTLAPGASTTCRATYQVTQQDLDAGSIQNTATAHGTPPGESPVESPPDEVTITAEANPGLSVTKSAEPETFSGPNQTITYTYRVTNTGNVTLTGIGVTDDQGLQVSCSPSTLAPGEHATCQATYTTTQADVDNGSITNSAYAYGTPPGGGTPIESPPTEETVTVESSPAIRVEKSAEPTSYSAAGQTITYTYRVTNTGNVTLNSVGITDDLPGLSAVVCDATSLAPEASTTCRATYQVTQQ
ncbi:hypothetical protein AB0J52_39125, partial [Spirillospora sp. NPDC049652]